MTETQTPQPNRLIRELDAGAQTLARKLRKEIRDLTAAREEYEEATRNYDAARDSGERDIAGLKEALRTLGHDPDEFIADL